MCTPSHRVVAPTVAISSVFSAKRSRLLGVLAAWVLFLPVSLAGEAANDAAAVSAGWASDVQRRIREAEYHVTWQVETKLADLDAAWQAPNRAHDLRTYFTPDGVRVVRRTEEVPSWEWGLELVGYGRGQRIRRVDLPTLVPQEERIRYDRGSVVEWYVNERRGLEQGFTLNVPPQQMPAANREPGTAPGARAFQPGDPPGDAPAYLTLLLQGGLTPVLSADGQAIDFHRGEGLQLLHYGELVVRDATDRELSAWMEMFGSASGRGIRLAFDDRGAVYPVTVDPLLSSSAWSAEGNQSGDECPPANQSCAPAFGHSVALVGDLNGDGYDDAAVGAPYYDVGHSDEGRVFVYYGSPSGLLPTPTWTVEAEQDGARLGWSVAGAGDVDGDGWDDLIVGAPGYVNPPSMDSGIAFVYHGTPAGLDHSSDCPDGEDWCPCPTGADWCALVPEMQDSGALTGTAVAAAGDINGDFFADVIFSAPLASNGQSEEGLAYVAYGSTDGLGTGQLVETNNVDGHLGKGPRSVAGAGDFNNDGFDDVLIGVPDANASGESGKSGWAGLWLGSATGLPSGSEWGFSRTLPDVHSDYYFRELGYAVAGAGDINGDGYADVLIGNPTLDLDDDPVYIVDAGVVYVLYGPDGAQFDGLWGSQDDEFFGWSLAGAGDLNGDGFADIIVGAPSHSDDQTNEGRVFVYYGSSTPLFSLKTTAWHAEGNQDGAFFGMSLFGAGDVNGDGHDDVIIGAPYYDGDKLNEGAAFVYHGAPEVTAVTLAEALGHIADHLDLVGTPPALFSGSGGLIWSPEFGVPAAGPGPVPGSVLISTGLVQDEGLGDTDFLSDGAADSTSLQLTFLVPEVLEGEETKKTLRFTTRIITSEDAADRSEHDSARLAYAYDGGAEQEMDLVGVLDFRLGDSNPPVSHAVSVEGRTSVTITFEIRDFNQNAGDGAHDSALVISRMFFSTRPLPPEETGDYLGNPAPRDVSLAAGTYAYRKTLFSVPGKEMPFDLSVLYNSGAAVAGALGPKWSHSFEAYVHKLVGADVLVRLGSGAAEYFKKSDAGTGACANGGADCDEFPVDDDCPPLPFGGPRYCIPETENYDPKFPGVFNSLTAESVSGGPFNYLTKDQVTYRFPIPVPETDPDLYLLETITDTNGNEILLAYDPNERLDYIRDTRGKIFTLNYDAQGQLSSVEYPEIGVGWPAVTFAYDSTGMLSSVTDSNGYTTTFTYDEAGNLLTATDDDGVTFVRNEYEEYQGFALQTGDRVVLRRNAKDTPDGPGDVLDYEGESLQTADRLGGQVRELFDVRERLFQRAVFLGTDSAGVSCAPENSLCWALWGFPEYDAVHNLPQLTTDPLNVQTSLAYDAAGNLTSRTKAQGLCVGGPENWASCDGDDDCIPATCGVVVETDHEARCVGGDNADEECTADTNCPNGRCSTSDKPRARAIHPNSLSDCDTQDETGPCYFYRYNDDYNIESETDELGYSVTYTYDNTDGLISGIEDRLGFVTNMEYTDEGYLSSIKRPPLDPGAPDPDLTRPRSDYEYDDLGRVTLRTTCAVGTDLPGEEQCDLTSVTGYAYDAGGRLLSIENPLGHSTTFVYDAWGRLEAQTSPATPWAPGGLVQTYSYGPTGRLTRVASPLGAVDYGYDAEDRLRSKTDPVNQTTSYTCDAADRLTTVEDPLGTTVTARHDAAGRLLAYENPNGFGTALEYDPLGRVTKEQDPLGRYVEMTYTPRGAIGSVSSGRGVGTTYSYDDAGRLERIELTPSGRTIQHTLDAGGNRTETTDTAFVLPVLRKFDGLGQLRERTGPFGNTVKYQYDLAGNLTELTYTDERKVRYVYDSLNRLTQVYEVSSDEPPVSILVATYAYDEAGNLTQGTLPDDSQVDYEYDLAHRLVHVVDSRFSVTFYEATLQQLDPAGRQILASETLPEPALTLPDLSSDLSYTYDMANGLTERDADSYTYDLDGNMTSGVLAGASRSMGYDEWNRLVGFDGDTFAYDADGFRVEAVRNSTTTRYVYDATSGRLLEEQDENGNIRARYVYGRGLISCADGDENRRVYHRDTRGSTVALTNASGQITDRYAYAPYGALLAHTDGVGTACDQSENCTENPFTFNGRDGVYDDGNGLYFMRSRHYAPELMRFIQKDRAFVGTLEDPQSLNRYAFVEGDPINRIDPDGETPLGALGGALIGAVVQATANAIHGEPLYEGVIGAAVEGAILGGFPPVKIGSAFLIGAAAAAFGELANQGIDVALSSDGGFDLQAVANRAALGAVSHGVTHWATGKLKLVKSRHLFDAGVDLAVAAIAFGPDDPLGATSNASPPAQPSPLNQTPDPGRAQATSNGSSPGRPRPCR